MKKLTVKQIIEKADVVLEKHKSKIDTWEVLKAKGKQPARVRVSLKNGRETTVDIKLDRWEVILDEMVHNLKNKD